MADAFVVVEELCRGADDDLRGALAAALLEGRWPRGHAAAMGLATREVRELAQRPSWTDDGVD